MARLETRQPELEVGLTGAGAAIQPEWVERRGSRLKVDEVLASWAEGGQGPSVRGFGRLNRTFFRIRLENGWVWEIAHELPEARRSGARWVLWQQLQGEGQPEPDAQQATMPKPAPKARPASTEAKKAATGSRRVSAKTKTPASPQKRRSS